ncbi:hypothetical protein Taro_051142 [Colocasia esculenta]|uniref:Uncharacterized protein n=1 Tax=Colocasia esculenta TaxID=4460 RepID=A0A843XG28_COLES|nr:hypothetical protein [Colocasia esculenta]
MTYRWWEALRGERRSWRISSTAWAPQTGLGRGVLERSGIVPIARRWDSPRDSRSLEDQLTRLQELIDGYPYLDVVWQPYLEEGDEGQPWLVQAHPYFGRSVWLYALNLVLPLNLYLCQRSLGLRQSAVEFPVRDRFLRPSRSFRGLHDTTDWRLRAQEQINNWECRGKAVKSAATTDDEYLQAYALKYGGKVYKSARHQVDVSGEIASLRALLHLAVQDWEAAQRQTAELRVGKSEVCWSRPCLLLSERKGLSIAPGSLTDRGGAESRAGSEALGGAGRFV